MQCKKVTALFVCLVLLVTVGIQPAMPQFFGGGIPVFDSAAFAEALIHTGKMVTQINQMIQTYNRITDQYNQMVQQAKYLTNMGLRYRSIGTIWRQVEAGDWYGKNAPWVQAVNTGLGAVGAWEKMTRRPTQYPALDKLPGPIQDLRTDEVGTLQLGDGLAVNTIDLVGRIRQAGPSREAVLAALESDAFSDAANLQTEAAQLNKIAALLTLLAKSQMDQNRLGANSLEMQLWRTKLDRDAMVNGLNQQTYAQANRDKFLLDEGDGPSEGLLNFEIQ